MSTFVYLALYKYYCNHNNFSYLYIEIYLYLILKAEWYSIVQM
jgi:hypothetical protein